jgi:glyoxylase-like metal-dependent hydrolase (beta-lactamase superfamily II)
VRRVLAVLGLLVLAGIAYVAIGLGWAHAEIRAIEPPLPSVDALIGGDPEPDLPTRMRWIDTASQRMPRSAVLDPSLDPAADAPYVMGHVAFVLEWADGRIFLVDAGMDREAALAFGAPIQTLSGAHPIEPHASAAEALGPAAARVAGIGFTHLHTDHTTGVAALCAAPNVRRIRLVQGRLQAERANYTTRGGAAQLAAAPCLEREVLDGDGVVEVPGFRGLGLVPAGGHTPCSQLFVAHVREGDALRTWIVTGDVVNQLDGALRDIPKPRLYSLLVVPEAPARLAEVRALLREAAARRGTALLVSHDRLALEASGMPQWSAP